jgi:hypothetical protein
MTSRVTPWHATRPSAAAPRLHHGYRDAPECSVGSSSALRRPAALSAARHCHHCRCAFNCGKSSIERRHTAAMVLAAIPVDFDGPYEIEAID